MGEVRSPHTAQPVARHACNCKAVSSQAWPCCSAPQEPRHTGRKPLRRPRSPRVICHQYCYRRHKYPHVAAATVIFPVILARWLLRTQRSCRLLVILLIRLLRRSHPCLALRVWCAKCSVMFAELLLPTSARRQPGNLRPIVTQASRHTAQSGTKASVTTHTVGRGNSDTTKLPMDSKTLHAYAVSACAVPGESDELMGRSSQSNWVVVLPRNVPQNMANIPQQSSAGDEDHQVWHLPSRVDVGLTILNQCV